MFKNYKINLLMIQKIYTSLHQKFKGLNISITLHYQITNVLKLQFYKKEIKLKA